MAGGHGDHHPVKLDPAVERWQGMHTSMYERFRMTPSKTRQVIVLAFAIPLLTYEALNYGDARWDWRGKTRQASILRVAPAAPAKGDDGSDE